MTDALPRGGSSKRCTECRQTKPIKDFYKRAERGGRPYPRCKSCHQARMKPLAKVYFQAVRKEHRRRAKLAALPPETMLCRICNESKSVGEFRFQRLGSKRRTICKHCERAPERKPEIRNLRNAAQRKQRQEDRARFALRDYRALDKRRGHTCDLDVEFIRASFAQGCSYCDSDSLLMTLDRKDNARGHTRDNVVPCCLRCNLIRGSMPYEAWLVVSEGVRRATEMGLLDGWGERPTVFR